MILQKYIKIKDENGKLNLIAIAAIKRVSPYGQGTTILEKEGLINLSIVDLGSCLIFCRATVEEIIEKMENREE